MCIILFSYKDHPEYRLILAANRDEFLDRPTTKLSCIQQQKKIFAGLDNKGGGTWLGLRENGKIAGITNFRNPKTVLQDAPSRGHLITNYLESDLSPAKYLNNIKKEKKIYNGFNLLIGDNHNFFYYSNINDEIVEITGGTYGLSNHHLDTPWPKVVKGKQDLEKILTQNKKIQPEKIFSLLKNKEYAPDKLLPDTGIGIEWEKMLSPIFISSPFYGTRASSIILVKHNGQTTFIERTFHYKNGNPVKEETEQITCH